MAPEDVKSLQRKADQQLTELAELTAERRKLPRRSRLLGEGERWTHAYAVHEGWAFRRQMLDDGRRQIIDVVLPGDLLQPPAASAESESSCARCDRVTTPVTAPPRCRRAR